MWLYFCLIAVICWAIVNVVDKFLLSKWLREPLLAAAIPAFLEIVSIIFIFFWKGISPMPLIFILFNIIAGILYAFPIIFYLEALKKEDVTNTVPLFHMSTVFVLILAAVFLNETFTVLKYLGIIILFIGVLLLTSKHFSHIGLNKSFFFMLLASISLASNVILTKYLLALTDIWTVYFFTRIGIFLVLFPLFVYFIKKIKYIVKEHGLKRILVMYGNSLLDIIGLLFFTFALLYGSVTLVNIFVMTKSFFVLLFTMIVCLFKPNVLKEALNKKNITHKLFAISMIFIGALIILL